MSDRKIHFNGGQEVWRYTICGDTVEIHGPDRQFHKVTFADIDPYTAQEIEEHYESLGEDDPIEDICWKWDVTNRTIQEYVAGQLRPKYLEEDRGRLGNPLGNQKKSSNRRNTNNRNRNHNRKGNNNNGRHY